jgi:outer membrane immunogenic protein
MKRIVLATALVALGSAPALAADLPPRSYDKAPAMAAPATNWSGLYVGGNVGYGWGSGDTSFSPTQRIVANNAPETTLDTKLQETPSSKV